MRHQFFRLFLSIILIAFAIIFVQCIVIFAGNWHLANSWKDLVFEEFISSLKTVIGNISDADSVMNVMVSRTTERISGLLIRDKDGQFVLSLGASPAGVQMPSPERLDDFAVAIPQGRLKLSYQEIFHCLLSMGHHCIHLNDDVLASNHQLPYTVYF